jgi:hypothetical protein
LYSCAMFAVGVSVKIQCVDGTVQMI